MEPDPSPHEPSSAAADRASASLLRRLGSRVLVGTEVPDLYLSDDSRVLGRRPLAVVLAETRADIEATLEIAERCEVPVTPRAGGSGRTGGAVPVLGGIVLSTHKMARLLDLDRREGTVTVEPGVVLDDLHRAVEAEGWFYPPDPNSAALCCIGGNLGENAAGPRAFKYGTTRDFVLGVEAVLMGGRPLFAGRRTRKGVTGYDVASFLVGSEGTLATFGAATLKLLPKPEHVVTMTASFSSFEPAMRAVERIVTHGLVPRCLEFLDDKTLEVMRAAGAPITDGAHALLLFELDGSVIDCERNMERVYGLLEDLALDVHGAETPEARGRLWEPRRYMSLSVRKRARHKISEDVVVPRTALVALVETVTRIGETHAIDAICYGHAGDGNLHVNFLWNEPDEEPRITSAIDALFRRTIELGGTLSGEHGIGLTKAPYLALEQSPDLIELELRLKNAFDPRGLMNPGKIFPSSVQKPHGNC